MIKLSKFFDFVTNYRYRYIVINTLVSLISIGRNVIFLNLLGLADIGQIALMQTIVLFVGLLQFGTLNGAFILFAEDKPEQTQRIVNLLTAAIAGLLTLAMLGALAGAGSLLVPLVAPETAVIGLIAGLCTLASGWMNNLLIAKGALDRSNLINIVAVSASLAVAISSASYGLSAALASILVQPLMVAVGALIVERSTRPTWASPDLETLKQLLQQGLMPFLGMLTVLLVYQIERWAIVFTLGAEALGQFYLVMMYTTFFALVPAALINVHFPPAKRAFQNAQLDQFKAIRLRHSAELFAYGALAIGTTFALLPIAVKTVAPQHESSIPLVWLVIPALLIFQMRDIASIPLFSMKRTRALFISGLIMIGAYSTFLGAALVLGVFSLEAVVILRGAAEAIATAVLFKWTSDELRAAAK